MSLELVWRVTQDVLDRRTHIFEDTIRIVPVEEIFLTQGLDELGIALCSDPQFVGSALAPNHFIAKVSMAPPSVPNNYELDGDDRWQERINLVVPGSVQSVMNPLEHPADLTGSDDGCGRQDSQNKVSCGPR